ncbi:MAG: hypothetical protein JNM00_06800, partial [Flavobacteriales bacterium]|nr:hypothetical protein [Flavobacteriales bacterium]
LNGGGLYALNGLITLQNNIIANSTNGGDCYAETATIDGAGHNLIESTGTGACGLTNGVNGNIIGSDPNLGSLTGSPAYFPLNTGSPAINAGSNAICAAAPVNNQSQNGVIRPSGSACDIGSYELLIPSPTSLVNSVLPTSRTPVVGSPVTIFNTVLNAGTETAYGVSLSMNPAPAGTFTYTQTNCANNAVIGSPNAAVDIPAGGVACYVLSFTPSAAFSATQVHIQAQAANASGTSLLPGINTWLLRSTLSAGPDVIALTTTTDFHQVACSGLNAFAVALSNVGAAASGDITVSANTGSASLPISVSIQETNPGTGAIIGDNILNNLGAGENRTVAVFVTFNGCVSFDPAANRIFIEFRDASNNVVGSTSTAVSTNR